MVDEKEKEKTFYSIIECKTRAEMIALFKHKSSNPSINYSIVEPRTLAKVLINKITPSSGDIFCLPKVKQLSDD
jgi:hypothetical protein